MASTVTYQYPVSGTVAPTTAQAAISTLLTASVQMGDTDTVATITHNWGVTATVNTQLMPIYSEYTFTAPTTSLVKTIVLATNTVVITKASATGSGGTFIVTLQKPHSINQ